FRLVQELVLEGTPQAQAALRGNENVTVRGALRYQACNDKECFNPVSVPVSWTMSLRPLIRQPSGTRKYAVARSSRKRNAQSRRAKSLEVEAAPLAATRQLSVYHDRRNAAYTEMLCALSHLVIPHIVNGHFAG